MLDKIISCRLAKHFKINNKFTHNAFLYKYSCMKYIPIKNLEALGNVVSYTEKDMLNCICIPLATVYSSGLKG